MIPEDFYLEKRFYYSRLNKGEKDFYKFLLELFFKRERKYTLAWQGDFIPDTPEVRALPSFIWGKYDEFMDFTKVHEAINSDCPEFFYVSQCELKANDDFSITVGKDGPMYTDEEIDHLEGLLWGIYHNFDHIVDPFELVLAVHDYITYNFDYDKRYDPKEGVTYSGRDFEEIFTVAGLIKCGLGVCAAIARLAQFILQRRGLEVAYLISEAENDDDGSESHAWLGVKLEDNWYHLDITWNESETLDKDLPQYVYFNVTDKEIMVDHDFKHEEYPEIVCNCTDYNYYHKLGLYLTTKEEIRAKFGEFLEAHMAKEKNMHFYFRTPADLETKIVSDALAREAIARKFAINQCLFANYDGYYAVEIYPDVFPEDEEASENASDTSSQDSKKSE